MDFNRTATAPLGVQRSRRRHNIRGITSLPAGKMVPVGMIPMLREDALLGGISYGCEMGETAELIMNPVSLRLMAYCVPWLAMPWFEKSRDQFDRSFKGEPQIEGGDVVPFFDLVTDAWFDDPNPGIPAVLGDVYRYLGLHAKVGQDVNGMVLAAYKAIWEMRAKNRSPSLDIADQYPVDHDPAMLLPAFMRQDLLGGIVPSFAQATMDGAVPLRFPDATLALTGGPAPVSLSGTLAANTATSGNRTIQFEAATNGLRHTGAAMGAGESITGLHGLSAAVTGIVAELSAANVQLTLADIDRAKRTVAMAKLREQFAGIDEDYVIDLLMDGVTIPDQFLSQPILVADQTVTFGQQKRYATDSGNLAESAVSGGATADLRVRVPRLSTGGVVMIVAEVMPEPLWESTRDPFFIISNARENGDLVDLPAYQRDYMDPERVDVVLNGDVDVHHGTPTLTFGYEGTNAKWNRFGTRIGGKFHSNQGTGMTDEDARKRFWYPEVTSPVLNQDFYLCPPLSMEPFLDQDSDPFELVSRGQFMIEGNTVFGRDLMEDTGSYEAVDEKVDDTRIDQTP